MKVEVMNWNDVRNESHETARIYHICVFLLHKKFVIEKPNEEDYSHETHTV